MVHWAVFLGSQSWRDFWLSGLASANRRINFLGGSRAMSTEAFLQFSLVFAVMSRAVSRFVSPMMPVCGSCM